MDDNNDSSEPKGKEPEASAGDVSPAISSWEDRVRRPSEARHRILFAPDPRERLRRESTTALTLSRTFSRQSRFSSYSAADDEENERVRRVTSRKTIEPHTRLPTCKFSIA
jgi:hypothetical protein